MYKIKCSNCGFEFEFDVDDLDIDYEVEDINKFNIHLIIHVSLRCEKCNRRIIYGTSSIEVPIKILGELKKKEE